LKKALIQALILGGFYFVISSLFIFLSNILGTVFALVFPFFVALVIILAFFKPIPKIVTFNDKHPNITLLLSVIGVYAYAYFTLNLYGIILEGINSDVGSYTSVLFESYGYWHDIIEDLLGFALVAGIIISCFVILYRNIRNKK